MDPCVALLFQPNISNQSRTLLIADENALQAIEQMPIDGDILLMTNRYDIFLKCQERKLQCQYTDFDFTALEPQSFDCVLYRISKERPVSHHIINNAYTLLKQGGQLILSGAKNEGIKSYTSNAAKLFGTKATAEKHGSFYRASLTKSAGNTAKWLDSKDYPAIRTIYEADDLKLQSKPGVFGWNKIDKGSQLLLDTAENYLSDSGINPKSLLDLGCGYGYISLRTKHWPSLEERWATDNNAAAILCTQANAKSNALNIETVADDCANSIDKRFDLILCNPPFHQGFEVDQSLTLKFLGQTQRHLNSDGIALFVVNQFIAIPKLAEKYFEQCTELASDGSFKVYCLQGRNH